MFVSVAIDPGSESRAKELADLLGQYGFDKIQRGLWESAFVSQETLTRLKRDLDRATDAFDRIRIFQFPFEGTLALTTLRDKKWRRMVARGDLETEAQGTAVKPAVPPGSAAQVQQGFQVRPAAPVRQAVQVRPAVPARTVNQARPAALRSSAPVRKTK